MWNKLVLWKKHNQSWLSSANGKKESRLEACGTTKQVLQSQTSSSSHKLNWMEAINQQYYGSIAISIRCVSCGSQVTCYHIDFVTSKFFKNIALKTLHIRIAEVTYNLK